MKTKEQQEAEDKLNRTPYEKNSTDYIAWAIKECAEALSEHWRTSVPHKVQRAQGYLNNFLEEIRPLPELTEKEASLSSSLHTYLRKYCDDETTTVLYNLISEGRGTRVWYEFVKNLVLNEKSPKQVRISLREIIEIDEKTLDERIMSAILFAWGEEDITKAVTDIKDWS